MRLKREVTSDIQVVVVWIETKVVKPRKEKRETGQGKRIIDGKKKENKI
jgi:hypothetical protein